MRLRIRDWKQRCDINSNAYKPREALRVRLKKLIFRLIFSLCDSFAGKLKALQEIQPAFQTQCVNSLLSDGKSLKPRSIKNSLLHAVFHFQTNSAFAGIPPVSC